jgi:hypothetical protein
VLYGSNTYTFIIDSKNHPPISLQSPRIFGLFGEANRLYLLRDLRSISISIVLNDTTHWCVKRQRARLIHFVSVLKQHSDDDNKKCLLQDLTVHMHDTLSPTDSTEKYMFSLESLADLRDIKNVSITGIPDWYAQCLQLCIQGRGGNVQESDWLRVKSERRVKSKKRGKSKKRATKWDSTDPKEVVQTRKWYQPMLDWKEFAIRNGVSVPDDIDKFWVVEK